MKVVLDEQQIDDSTLIANGIDFVFNKKDRLYIHKSLIDYDPSQPERGVIVTPWFNGF